MLLGEIDIMKIRNVVFRIELYHHFTASQLMTDPKARLSDALPMADVMQAFDNTGANWLPVFDMENRLKGYVSRQRIYDGEEGFKNCVYGNAGVRCCDTPGTSGRWL